MDLPIMVADCFRAVTNAARFSQRMLTYTASIVNVTFLYVVLLTQQLGYIAISFRTLLKRRLADASPRL